MKALKNEIDAILSNKLRDVIEAFQIQRDADIAELVELRKAVETIETEKADVQKKMGNLNTKRAVDLGEYNRSTQKLSWLERQVKGKKGQIAVLMEKLTQVEVDPKSLTLLLHFREYHEKEGGENEKG